MEKPFAVDRPVAVPYKVPYVVDRPVAVPVEKHFAIEKPVPYPVHGGHAPYYSSFSSYGHDYGYHH